MIEGSKKKKQEEEEEESSPVFITVQVSGKRWEYNNLVRLKKMSEKTYITCCDINQKFLLPNHEFNNQLE